jgi:hypothetical protein
MQVDLAVQYSERPPVSGELEVRTVPLAVRVGKALGSFFGLGGLGAVLVFVPGLHLCGVVVLLLATPLVSWFIWQRAVFTVGEQTVACPKCAAPVRVGADTVGWPVRFLCEPCGTNLTANAPRPKT